MPYDRNGHELRVGERVTVPCRVKAIHLNEEYCNVDLETEHPMYPGDHVTPLILNSKQVERA